MTMFLHFVHCVRVSVFFVLLRWVMRCVSAQYCVKQQQVMAGMMRTGAGMCVFALFPLSRSCVHP